MVPAAGAAAAAAADVSVAALAADHFLVVR